MPCEIVEVKDRLTLEFQGVSYTIPKKHFSRLSSFPFLEGEISEYCHLREELHEKIQQFGSPQDTTRQNIIVHSPDNTGAWCWTSLQLLRGRKNNTLIANMRSNSSSRVQSDLAFLCIIGISYNVENIVVNVGSFHIEL